MAKYLQRSCPKCNGYLGIVAPYRKAKMTVQAINVMLPEMWLPACVGISSRKNINATKSTTFQSSLTRPALK